MNKITAVEWFAQQLPLRIKNMYSDEIIKCKEMEKEQMRLIYEGLLQNVGTSIKESDLPTFEEYYNHTYQTK